MHKLAAEIDDLLAEVRGGKWRPRYFFRPQVYNSIMTSLEQLRDKLIGLDAPNVQKYVARLALNVAYARKYQLQNQVQFMTCVSKTLYYSEMIIEWYYRNKGMKEKKNDINT